MRQIAFIAALALAAASITVPAYGQATEQSTNPAATEATTEVEALSFDAQIVALGGESERRAAADQLSARVGVPLFGVTSDNNDLPQFSWGIPRSPALTLAGLADTKVPTSDSLRSFVVSLPTTLNNDEQGQAIALDISLSQLISPDPSPTALYSYRGEWLSGDRQAGATQREPDSAYQRWLRRSRVGIAIYEGVEDSDVSKNVPARLAVGFSTSLWDESDPIMQNGPNARAFTDECAVEILAERNALSSPELRANLASFDNSPEARRIVALNALSEELGLGQPRLTAQFNRSDIREPNFIQTVEGLEQYFVNTPNMRAAMLEATKDCAQRASQIAELRRDLDIGIGLLYRGEPGQFSEFDERGAAAWIAFRYPWGVDLINPDFGTNLVDRDTGDANSTDPLANVSAYWLVAGSARFSQDEFIATGNDVTPEIQVDQAEAWIGFERYSQRLRFGAFYGYSEVKAVEAAGEPFERSGERYVISAQYRLGNADDSGLWLGITYGNAGNAANADNDDTLMFSLNFAPQPAYVINQNRRN